LARNGLEIAKRIYDCVHGYIELTETELKVINAPVFQRLHHVRQLGLSFLVYPTAQHSRFSHSLGVLYVVSEFIDALKERNDQSTTLDSPEDIQTLRLAALLHDIGHHPFSHVLENSIVQYDSEEAKHENFGKWIIENTSIRDQIEDYNIEKIGAMITKSHTERVYNSLISSDLDVDRLDYLLRDAYFTGVAYGAIDVHRLLGIVRIRDGNVVYDLKGLATIEAYLMARMAMYRAVYHHKTSIGFSLLLNKVYEHLRNNKSELSTSEIKTQDESEFCSYNDSYILGLVRDLAGNDNIIGQMANAIVHRHPLKLADVVHSYEVGSNGYTRLAPLRLEKPIQSLADDAGIEPDWILYKRVATKFIELDESPIMIDHEEWQEPLEISRYRKSAIADLIDKQYYEDRVYTHPDYVERLKTALSERYGN
jgi:HD superfamily phosphohydrolase